MGILRKELHPSRRGGGALPQEEVRAIPPLQPSRGDTSPLPIKEEVSRGRRGVEGVLLSARRGVKRLGKGEVEPSARIRFFSRGRVNVPSHPTNHTFDLLPETASPFVNFFHEQRVQRERPRRPDNNHKRSPRGRCIPVARPRPAYETGRGNFEGRRRRPRKRPRRVATRTTEVGSVTHEYEWG